MSVLHHLALQCEALVILLQETHCTSVERLDLPSYHLAGFSLSRKHGLATFVHERLKWILIDQSPPTSEIEWVCVDVDNYKIVNVYKPPPTRMQASDLPAFPHPCLYSLDVVSAQGGRQFPLWPLENRHQPRSCICQCRFGQSLT